MMTTELSERERELLLLGLWRYRHHLTRRYTDKQLLESIDNPTGEIKEIHDLQQKLAGIAPACAISRTGRIVR